MISKIFLAVLACTIVVGCANNAYRPPAAATSDPAGMKLAEAASSVSQSLTELARIQAVATPPVRGASLPDPASYGMEQRVSIDWVGPITPVLRNIAKASGYRLRTLGNPPATEIMVSVMAKNAMLGDLLRDVAFQAGHKAKIQVYPATKVIECRYAKT